MDAPACSSAGWSPNLANKPNSIIGDFIDYLLARHQSRILAIHIMAAMTIAKQVRQS